MKEKPLIIERLILVLIGKLLGIFRYDLRIILDQLKLKEGGLAAGILAHNDVYPPQVFQLKRFKTTEIIKLQFPQVELIQSDINIGFGKANNIGIKIVAEGSNLSVAYHSCQSSEQSLYYTSCIRPIRHKHFL